MYRTPNGKQQFVALVGADRNARKRFPAPDAHGSTEGMSPDAMLYDVSDRDLIQVTALPTEVEVNRHRASIDGEIEGYGACLGVPFLFTSNRNATRYLTFGPEEAMYVLLRVDRVHSISDVQQSLRQRLPEVDVLTRDEFARKSRTYWTITVEPGPGARF